MKTKISNTKKSVKKKIINNERLMKVINYISAKIFTLMDFLIPINKTQILFISFGGESIGDSPREIFNSMLVNDIIDDYQILWAVNRNLEIPTEVSKNSKIINANSILYFYYLFRSNIWITNVGMGRGMKVESKNRLYINTWHGTPLKKIGKDVYTSKKEINRVYDSTYYCYQTLYEKDIFLRNFPVKEDNLLPVGLPRNDVLFNKDNIDVFEIKEKINVNFSSQLILYAPTWRNNNNNNSVYLDLENISNKLNDNQIILYRGHHAMSKIYSQNIFNNRVIDVSNYESVTELLLICDILITDYSSIMVDYSILKKPILLFAPDYREYVKDRGVYFNIKEEFNEVFYQNEDDLLATIKTENYKKRVYYETIYSKFNVFGGMATDKIIKIIKEGAYYE